MEANKTMLFGFEYPVEIVRLWRKIHNNRNHLQQVHAAFALLFPNENQSPHGRDGITGNEIKEKMLKERGWDCTCNRLATAEIANMARRLHLNAYYLG